MRLFDVLQPVFAYAAHLKPAAPGQDAPADALRHLEILLAKARAQRSAFQPDNFDRAWLALCAWLGETVNLDCIAPYFPDGNPAEGFFATLDTLLPNERNCAAPGHDVDALRTYTLALDLGFAGRHSEPRPLAQLESYRQRCRRALLRLSRHERAVTPPPQPPTPPISVRVGTVLCWVVPVTVTTLLYAFYRLFLTSLYSNVVG